VETPDAAKLLNARDTAMKEPFTIDGAGVKGAKMPREG
jgi:hypothetical protein